MTNGRTFAPGLKRIEDATRIRRSILIAFEQAELTDDADERRRLLTFVIVGGGATGVEMAGAIAEVARQTLAADFRRIDPRSARIVLVEAGPRLLPTLSGRISPTMCARRSCDAGVEVKTDTRVTKCDAARRRYSTAAASTPATHDLGRRRRRLAGRALARRRGRSRRPREGRSRSVGARASGDFRHRRHRDGYRRDGQSGARHRPGGKADGPICRQADRRAHRRPAGDRHRSATCISANWRPSAAARRW